jgi:hypothetical protein
MLDKRRRSPGAVIWYERSALESRGYSISDRRSGGFKRETYGNKFYTPILNWTLELLKLRTGVL